MPKKKDLKKPAPQEPVSITEALNKYGMPLIHVHASDKDKAERRINIDLWFGQIGKGQ